MNIYTALADDHNRVRAMLSELVGLHEDQADRRVTLVQSIRDALIPHSRAEEAVFYNSLREVDASKSLVMHSFMEHAEAEAMLRGLQAIDKFSSAWRPLAAKLKSTLEHHIEDEEGELFNAAKIAFTEEEAVAMAAAFKALKPKIKEEGIVGTTLDMIVNLMPPRFSENFVKRITTSATRAEK